MIPGFHFTPNLYNTAMNQLDIVLAGDPPIHNSNTGYDICASALKYIESVKHLEGHSITPSIVIDKFLDVDSLSGMSSEDIYSLKSLMYEYLYNDRRYIRDLVGNRKSSNVIFKSFILRSPRNPPVATIAHGQGNFITTIVNRLIMMPPEADVTYQMVSNCCAESVENTLVQDFLSQGRFDGTLRFCTEKVLTPETILDLNNPPYIPDSVI